VKFAVPISAKGPMVLIETKNARSFGWPDLVVLLLSPNSHGVNTGESNKKCIKSASKIDVDLL